MRELFKLIIVLFLFQVANFEDIIANDSDATITNSCVNFCYDDEPPTKKQVQRISGELDAKYNGPFSEFEKCANQVKEQKKNLQICEAKFSLKERQRMANMLTLAKKKAQIKDLKNQIKMESSAHSALTNAKDDEIDELKKEINDLKAYKGNESALLISKDEIINTLKENTINLLKAKNDQISDLRALLNEKDQQLTKYKNEGESDKSDSEIYIEGTRRIQVAGNPSFTAPFIRPVSDWTVILRRVYGNVSFSRDWNEYKNGFGDPNGGDFHIGLDNLYSMLRTRQHELYVSVKDVIGSTGYARYDNFKINHENASYNLLSVGEYKGTAGDSLSFHVGLNFTAKGRDPVYRSPNNDLGGWWFKTTKENERAWLSNLNGKYYESGIAPNKRGITWGSFSDFNYSISLTFAQMMIRPRP